ncbi:Fe-S cluster assembly protein SufD [Paenibacillus beijingensis]|uniref:Fe-S cluster assembly protein SufD n=1 Tax=Paenibacillus beijingensis TaxID=1126833 RepID=A0A0D5NL15_9BACL|nr:Fe-S cluster assembly protein SufD [Paenibacillus beijingensis]AJY75956.1 Fe-S cluster assembly protein SufD [Paenibacillus beijingensis]
MSIQLTNPVNRTFAEQLSASKGEPAWLTALRGEAAEAAESLEWPKPEKTRIDRWNLTAFGQYKKPEALSSTAELPASVQALLPQDGAAPLHVQRGSGAAFTRISEELKGKGVIFTDLESAARDHADLVQKYLFQALRKDENKLNALHAALWNGGVFVYVPKNVEVDIPLQAIYYNDDEEASFAPHIVVVAERGSSVTYVDYVVTTESSGQTPLVHHSAVEVYVGAGAQVRFASIHHMNDSVVDMTIRKAVVENDGRIEWIIGDLHDGNTLSDTISLLKGNGSSSDAKVISIGAGAQKMSLTTQAVHVGRSSESAMVTRAVMRDEATAIINGVTKIEKGATKANGEQTEKVMMLSPKARGDANPILLIDEDDVKAGHAASVGQVNPEQVYYLMSRGISKSDAERLIIYGFLAPVVSAIPLDSVREQLQRLLERKLEA